MNLYTMAISTDGINHNSKLVGVTYCRLRETAKTILVATGADPEKTIDFHGITRVEYANTAVSLEEAAATITGDIINTEDTFILVNNKKFIYEHTAPLRAAGATLQLQHIVDVTKLGTVFLKTIEHLREYSLAKKLWCAKEFGRVKDILDSACDHTSYKKWLQKYDISGYNAYPASQVLAIEILFRSIWLDVVTEAPELKISDIDNA